MWKELPVGKACNPYIKILKGWLLSKVSNPIKKVSNQID